MPALQRTPPQKTGKSPAKPYDRPAESPEARAAPAETLASPAQTPKRAVPLRSAEGNGAMPTTPRAFLPRAQKVMRTPPGGTGSPAMAPPPIPVPVASSSSAEAPAPVPAEVQADTDIFVEEQIAAGTSTAPRKSIYPSVPAGPELQLEPPVSTTPTISPQPRKSTTPLHPPPTAVSVSAPAPESDPSIAQQAPPAPAEAGPSRPAAPITPAPRTPRSRRAAEPISDPLPTIEVEEEEQWGKRYDATLNALKLAIDSAASKWEPRELRAIFPLLAAKFPQELSQICADASASMKGKIKSEAKVLFEHYRVGRALQMLDAVVKDGKDYAASNSEVRPDAWRPDLSPEALTASANLGIYDEAHERLRTEYLALHQDCSTRFSSIQAKQAQLAELEMSITETVSELDQVLDGFPTGDMKDWAETTMGRMEGGRVVEKA